MSELQAEFNQKIIEHLEALGNRLSSIERLLSAEFNADQESSDNQEIFQKVDEARKEFLYSLSAESKPEPQETEWRPMSEAPREEKIRVKMKTSGIEYYAVITPDAEWWACSITGHPAGPFTYYYDGELSGWRPL